MNSTHPTRAQSLALTGLLSSALGTIPLSRLPRPLQVGYVVLPGALTAGATYLALRSAKGGGQQRTRAHSAGWSVGLGGLAVGAGAAGLWMDRAIENALRRRGVPFPRLAMGIATGGVMTALTALEPEGRDHPAVSETTSEPAR